MKLWTDGLNNLIGSPRPRWRKTRQRRPLPGRRLAPVPSPQAAGEPTPATPAAEAPAQPEMAAPAAGATGGPSFVARQQDDEMLTGSLVGTQVLNAADEFLGEINDVLLAADGRLKAAVVGVGGFLGIAERDVAVPWDALAVSRDEDEDLLLRLDISREQLRGRPRVRDRGGPPGSGGGGAIGADPGGSWGRHGCGRRSGAGAGRAACADAVASQRGRACRHSSRGPSG